MATNSVTLQGNALTLVGNQVEIGQPAPDFTVIDNDMQPVQLKDFIGKVTIISAVPSLDTPVCSAETRQFNELAGKLSPAVQVVTISMDLPFAQKRWCGAAKVDRVLTFSDYRDRSFGNSYGVLIDELKLLSRAVFVIDREGIIQYIQLVPEIAQEPDYNAVVAAIKELI